EFQGTPCIINDGRDLPFMADNAGILHQARNIVFGVSRNAGEVEPMECCPEVLAFLEYGSPAEPRLKAFHTQFFEQPAIIGDRKAPFRVVIPKILRRAEAPGTAGLAVRPG